MKEHKFDSNIDNIYNKLSNEQKSEYKSKQDKINKVSISIGVVFAIILVAMIVGFGVWLSIEKEYALLAFTAVVVVLLGAIVYWLISSGVRDLKSTDEVKIKRWIERLERQKNISAKNTTNTSDDIETKITYYPSNEENATILSLTNKFYLDFVNNVDLCDIIKKNIDIIKISVFDAELACCPFQKQNIVQITYTPMQFSKVLKNESKQYKTIFCLPTVDGLKKTQYIDFIASWNNETIRKANIALSKILEYKQNRTGVTRGIYEQSNKYYAIFSKAEEIYSLLKRQQIIHSEVDLLVNQDIIDKAQYNAFLYIIRNFLIENLKNAVNNIVQVVNMPVLVKQQEIIANLYNSPLIDRDSILTYYCVLEYSKMNSNSMPLTKVFHDNYANVQKIIQDLQDEAQLKDLRSGNYQKKRQYSMLEIDKMLPAQFESFVAELFVGFGYKAETTKLSGDQGIDVVAKKGNQILAIQAKHYNQAVGNHAIMEVVGGAKFYNATICYVVTNNYFTKSAKELAAANNVILWDRDKLIEKLSEI